MKYYITQKLWSLRIHLWFDQDIRLIINGYVETKEMDMIK